MQGTCLCLSYPSHGIVCPDCPFFEETPIDGHGNDDEDGKGEQKAIDAHEKTKFALNERKCLPRET